MVVEKKENKAQKPYRIQSYKGLPSAELHATGRFFTFLACPFTVDTES